MPTRMFVRSGECNMCGDCCGRVGSNPWCPGRWPDAFRAWTYKEDIDKTFPLNLLIPLEQFGGPKEGEIDFEGSKIPYKWVDGHSLCKSDDDHSCPMLIEATEDQHRCRLVGTEYEWMWEQACKPMPQKRLDERRVNGWFEENPNCSYIYEMESQ